MPHHRVLAGLALIALLAAPPAGAQYFGKNKVHYSRFDWQVIETEHFRVHYYSEEVATARDAARMAERSYARLSHALRHEVSHPIPLVLYATHSQFQQTNILQDLIDEGTGGVTEFQKQRVFLPFSGSYAELEHVLSHELVHAFQIDILYGRSQGVLNNPFTFQPPGWFMEGMAEYLSLGGVDPNTEMWLRDAALQGYLVPLNVLEYVGDIRVYRFGQSIWEYVARRFGEEKVGDILRKTAQVRDAGRAVEHVLGITMERLSDDWQENVRVTYLPQIAQYRKVTDYAKRLTRHDKDGSNINVVPAISPTGDKISFISDRTLSTGLYLASAIDGRLLGRLAEGERRADFESFRFFTSSADWSPDGHLLAVPVKSGARDAICLFDVRARKVTRRLEFDAIDAITSPCWSPDGARLAFSGEQGGRSDLFVVDADGGNLTRLTSDRYADKQPHWSPDGGQIAFVTDRGEGTDLQQLEFARYRVALLELASGTVTALPGMSGKNITPHWSADGKEILFVSDRTGINNLFVLNLDSGQVRQISDLLTGVSGITEGSPPLTVSRDGRRAVFSAFERGGWDLFALKDPFAAPGVKPLPAPPSPILATTVVGDSVPGGLLVTRPVHGEPGGLGRVALAVPTRHTELPDSSTDLGQLWRDPQGMTRRPADRPRGEDDVPPDFQPGSGPPRTPADSTVFVQVPLPGGGADSSATPGAAPGSGGLDSLVARPGPAGAAEFDSLRAALSELPDTSGFKDRPYRTHFSTDYAATQAIFGDDIGLAGLAVLSFSDMLGNRVINVAAGVYGNIIDSDIYAQYIDQSHRINYGVGLFQYRNDIFLLSRPFEDEFQTLTYRGGELFLLRPFDKFRRLELSLQAVTVKEKRILAPIDGTQEETIVERPTYGYVEPGIALVKDTAVYGPTGPIGGTRIRLGLNQAIGGASFTNVLVDMRAYLNFARRYSLSGRVLSANSLGENPFVYRAGGPLTVRSTAYGDLEGSRMLLGNLELRVPFIDRLSTSFPLPLDWPSLRGALFMDVGAGWGEMADGTRTKLRPFDNSDGFRLNDLTAAFGMGVRMGFGFLILRYDVAQPTNFQENLGHALHFFSIGADF